MHSVEIYQSQTNPIILCEIIVNRLSLYETNKGEKGKITNFRESWLV